MRIQLLTNLIVIMISLILAALSLVITQSENVSELEFWSVVVSYICTMMFLLQKRIAYIYGTISTFLLCWLFYESNLYGLSLFNGILVVTLFIGYLNWKKDDESIPITKTLRSDIPKYFLWFIGSAFVFRLSVGGDNHIDLLLASMSVLAQIMLNDKKHETWLVWITVNLISIPLFISQELYLLAVQFGFFTINAITAYLLWNKHYKKDLICVK